MSALVVEDIRKGFGRVAVLEDVSLTVAEGEFMVLLGPSGCGKSTLLNIVAGLETAEAGRVLIGGVDVTEEEPRRRDIAMVFQSYALYPTMSVRRNMGFGLRMRRTPRAEIERRVVETARLLRIEELLDRRPAELSGGQRQRVAIGRAIVREPRVFLFDEPLSNLDAKLRGEMRAELKRLHQRLGATILYVTHDQVEAMTLATRVAVMNRGMIEQVGAPQAVYDRPDTLFVAGFTGVPPMNLVAGRVVAGAGGTGFRAEGAPRDVPLDGVSLEAGRPVILGLRPEHIGDPSAIPPERRWVVEVAPGLIEPTGADSHVSFRWGEAALIGRFKPGEAAPGRQLLAAFDLEHLALYDAVTGRRIEEIQTMQEETRAARYPTLAGRTVLITGGAAGIGAAMVEAFLEQNAKVAFIDRDETAAAVLLAHLGAIVPVPVFIPCDLTDIAALRQAVARVSETLGPIRALVNNAARDDRHAVAEVTPEMWDGIMAVNLRHQFFATQAVADGMAAAGGGAVVNMGSTSWMAAQGGMPGYLTAKAGITGLTRALARDLGPRNIRVNAVLPGWTMTERQQALWLTPEAERDLLARQCLKRKLMPRDVASMVLFLAADDSAMCTSQNYIVDGGWV